MKNFVKNTSLVINLILFLVVLFMQYCRHCPEQKPCPDCNDSVVVITPHDTIFTKGDTIYYPKPADTLHDSIPVWIPVDTAAILKDYYTKYKYDLPIWNDSNAKINCYLETYRNQVFKYKVSGSIIPHNKEYHHYHTIVEPEKPRIKGFLGGGLQYSMPDTTMSLHIAAGLLTKKNNLLYLTYDPFIKVITFDTDFIIRFGRNKK